ncbi:hypothetical protein HCH52_01635 [Oscillospiraceae bacterium HV4-5-C5C]|nr:hypothetical protein [Oscillospiraceae bacterium HV4-5-C5C]
MTWQELAKMKPAYLDIWQETEPALRLDLAARLEAEAEAGEETEGKAETEAGPRVLRQLLRQRYTQPKNPRQGPDFIDHYLGIWLMFITDARRPAPAFQWLHESLRREVKKSMAVCPAEQLGLGPEQLEVLTLALLGGELYQAACSYVRLSRNDPAYARGFAGFYQLKPEQVRQKMQRSLTPALSILDRPPLKNQGGLLPAIWRDWYKQRGEDLAQAMVREWPET